MARLRHRELHLPRAGARAAFDEVLGMDDQR
jgi:hypothetical protein